LLKPSIILETLREIALFLDTPVFLIQEDTLLLSDSIGSDTELLLVFENAHDKDFKNKQGERVLDKLLQALTGKHPTLAQMPKAELVAEKRLEWNLTDTSIQKVVIFSENVAKQTSLQSPLYQITEQQNIRVVVSKPLEIIETQIEEKKALWNTLLQLFEG